MLNIYLLLRRLKKYVRKLKNDDIKTFLFSYQALVKRQNDITIHCVLNYLKPFKDIMTREIIYRQHKYKN